MLQLSASNKLQPISFFNNVNLELEKYRGIFCSRKKEDFLFENIYIKKRCNFSTLQSTTSAAIHHRSQISWKSAEFQENFNCSERNHSVKKLYKWIQWNLWNNSLQMMTALRLMWRCKFYSEKIYVLTCTCIRSLPSYFLYNSLLRINN